MTPINEALDKIIDILRDMREELAADNERAEARERARIAAERGANDA